VTKTTKWLALALAPLIVACEPGHGTSHAQDLAMELPNDLAVAKGDDLASSSNDMANASTDGGMSPDMSPVPHPIIYTSNRNLDGTDTVSTNQVNNIWGINYDGNGSLPLTQTPPASSSTSLVSMQPRWSPDGSKILFDSPLALPSPSPMPSVSPNPRNIWVMNADGSSPRPLTSLTTASAGDASWSPDGTKIAFGSARALDGSDATNPASNVWVMDATGASPSPVTHLTAAGIFTGGTEWSPDGTRIRYYSSRATNGSDANAPAVNPSVWLITPQGTGDTVVAPILIGANDQPWSADSQQVAYTNYNAGPGTPANIYVGDGTNPPTNLTPSAVVWSFAPVWSSTNKIAFLSNRALNGTDTTIPAFNIWVMDANGTNATALTNHTTGSGLGHVGQGISGAVWSSDGSKIVYQSGGALDGGDGSNTEANLWSVNADGSGAHPVTQLTTSGSCSSPNARP
jgi:Tol biopolymer transport system component